MVKTPTYRKVDEAGNTEADASKDSGEHKTSRHTDSKKAKRQKAILKAKDNTDNSLVFC